jgi:hypothetical protein
MPRLAILVARMRAVDVDMFGIFKYTHAYYEMWAGRAARSAYGSAFSQIVAAETMMARQGRMHHRSPPDRTDDVALAGRSMGCGR